MKSYLFKLYFPSGKTFMSREFDDEDFVNRFNVVGKKIFYVEDNVITIADYPTSKRAYEVLDDLIDAYHAHQTFTLPKNKKSPP